MCISVCDCVCMCMIECVCERDRERPISHWLPKAQCLFPVTGTLNAGNETQAFWESLFTHPALMSIAVKCPCWIQNALSRLDENTDLASGCAWHLTALDGRIRAYWSSWECMMLRVKSSWFSCAVLISFIPLICPEHLSLPAFFPGSV